MGFYQRYVFPCLLHQSMKARDVRRHRERLIPNARGRVLEIGIGSGLNLPFYGSAVETIDGIDPSVPLLAKAGRAVASLRRPVTLHLGSAEALPLASGTVDTVVSTWTLCSVARVDVALAEIRRVLKPDGSMIFIEHGLAPEPGVARWQHRLDPLWTRCAGGCHVDRDIGAMVVAAGFRLAHLETGYMVRGPRLLTWHYEGLAQPV